MQLKNKTYFVTGATGALGSALVLKLSQLGATVIASDKNPRTLNQMCDHLLEQKLPEPISYPMNLLGATPDDFKKLADLIEQKIGQLDGLIHTAAEFFGLTPFEHYEGTRWLKEMQVNLNAPVFLTQALLPNLVRSKGKIVFTLDDAKHIEQAYWGCYAVAKASIKTFAQILSEELENRQVSVKTITPPPMHTALRAKAWPGESPDTLSSPAEVVESYVRLLCDSAE